jgi:hypothetical protein
VVNAPFNGPNAVNAVGFAAPGCFDSNGTGQWISSTPSGGNILGSGIAFGVGSLSGAMTGALTSILDVNFMQGVRSTRVAEPHQEPDRFCRGSG